VSRAIRVVESMHIPTQQKREQVCRLVSCGLTIDEISFVLDCAPHEIREHYEQELLHGASLVTSMVGAALLKQALRGDVNAARFWLQSRAKWTIPQHVELTGRDGGPVQVEHRRALMARVLELAKGNKAREEEQEELEPNRPCEAANG
jgi:hypothetical protein